MQSWIGSLTTKLALSAVVATGLEVPLAAADPYAVIYRFQGKADGQYPLRGVTADAAGNLYGTTPDGGRIDVQLGCGTVYELTKPAPGGTAWTHTVLHKLGQSLGSPDGTCHPSGAPALRGNLLYGVLRDGTMPSTQYGSIYRLKLPDGPFKVLHNFDNTQGSNPEGEPLFGPDGTLYGAARYGGPNNACKGFPNEGVFYRLGPAGGFRILHNFGHGTGTWPNGELIFGPDGAIYGTTTDRCNRKSFGGSVVYRITTDGSYSMLYAFEDERGASDHLAAGPNGTLYGTSESTQPNDFGNVWSLKPGAAGEPWAFTVIFSSFGYAQGVEPQGVIRDNAGNLYGTTIFGGAYSNGVLYRLSPSTAGSTWTFTILHEFGGDSDGVAPNPDLTLVDGVLYGTTRDRSPVPHSPKGYGTVFSYKLR